MMNTRGVAGVVLSLVGGIAMLATATSGFRAFTTDAARARAVEANAVTLPDIALRDQHDSTVRMAVDQRSTIVDFIYTRCVTVCSELSGTFQQLQSQIRSRKLADRVRLLSVSFDPAWDTSARLRSYGVLMRADPHLWTLATVRTPGELPRLLSPFGVRVIADGNNGFVHNAALHVVNPRGQLVAILPIDATDAAIEVALRHAEASQ